LASNDFDVPKTLLSIDEERLSSTELILKKYKNKENALLKIHLAIEDESGLERKFSITEESLSKLNSYQYALIVVLEWLDYEAFEGFDYALNFRLMTTTEVLKNDFLLTDVAKNLEKAFDYKAQVQSKYEHKWHWTKINNQIQRHKKFQAYNKQFEENKHQIIDKLYEFVCKNLSFFP
jgi:hypothetical protein